MPVSYQARVFQSMSEFDAGDWAAVQQAAGDVFLDARFLAAIQDTMPEVHCRPVVIYDDRSRPAAISSLCAAWADMLWATGILKGASRFIRRMWPNYLRFKIVACGPPVRPEPA